MVSALDIALERITLQLVKKSKAYTHVSRWIIFLYQDTKRHRITFLYHDTKRYRILFLYHNSKHYRITFLFHETKRYRIIFLYHDTKTLSNVIEWSTNVTKRHRIEPKHKHNFLNGIYIHVTRRHSVEFVTSQNVTEWNADVTKRYRMEDKRHQTSLNRLHTTLGMRCCL